VRAARHHCGSLIYGWVAKSLKVQEPKKKFDQEHCSITNSQLLVFLRYPRFRSLPLCCNYWIIKKKKKWSLSL